MRGTNCCEAPRLLSDSKVRFIHRCCLVSYVSYTHFYTEWNIGPQGLSVEERYCWIHYYYPYLMFLNFNQYWPSQSLIFTGLFGQWYMLLHYTARVWGQCKQLNWKIYSAIFMHIYFEGNSWKWKKIQDLIITTQQNAAEQSNITIFL